MLEKAANTLLCLVFHCVWKGGACTQYGARIDLKVLVLD